MHCYKPMVFGCLLTFFLIGLIPRHGESARLATEEKVPENSPAQPAAATDTAPSKGILFNFKDVDLLQIIDLISNLTGKNFLVDEKVRGKVTVISPRPVNLDEAYNVFLSILEVQGFTVVPQGPITKIVPSREVKERPLPTAINGQRELRDLGDAFVTQLIPLEHADADEIRGLLAGLMSKEGGLLAYAPTNTLILTEVQSNVSRLMKIIQALDVEAPEALLKVLTLRYASADEMATSLQTVLEGLAQVDDADTAQAPQRLRRTVRRSQQPALSRAPTAPKIIADSRTNSLVVIATPSVLEAAEDLIAKLDVPTPEGRGQIHVYYLEHADAEELAQVLTAQASEIGQSRTGSQAQGRPPQQPQQTTAQRASTTGTTPLGITITADKPTNSLVITAPPEAYAVLKEIIQKLDIRRSQVLVEALFAEVTLSTAQSLGVEWRIIDDPDSADTQIFGSSVGTPQTGVLNQLSDPTNAAAILSATPSGLIIGALRNTITIEGQELLNIPAVLRAFEGNTDVNVLATPNLLTTDNEEAEIIIGEERPFLRSTQDTPSGGVVSSTRSFEFRDVGITLRLTPQISYGRTVRLNLFIELTAFVDEAEVGAVTTTKRSTQTTVVADNAQTIVIGGLIREDENNATTQVPCLGNVPLLGWAFRQESERKTKNNLLIFITPHILNTADEIERTTEHKRLQSDRATDIREQLQRSRPQENHELLLN